MFFLLSFAWVGQASTPVFKMPLPEIETLSNGLQVVWYLNESIPLTEISYVIRAGFRQDPVGKSGLVDLLSTSIDRGSEGKSSHQIARSLDVLGGSLYTLPEDDNMILGVRGLSQDANELFNILTSIVIRPDFPESVVKKEQSQMIDRINHFEDQGDAITSLVFRKIVAAGTPYARGNFESVREFKSITRADLTGFHKKYFVPKNALLVIVGRVDRAQLKSQIVSQLAKWRGGGPQKAETPVLNSSLNKELGSAKQQKIIAIDSPGRLKATGQAYVRIGFRAPPIQSEDHYKLAVINAALGEQFNSRLNSLIRDKLGLTYAIRSGFTYAKDFSDYSIVASARNESVGKLVSKSIEVLKGLKSDPLSQAEVEAAKAYLMGGFPVSTDTLHAVAARWLIGYLFGLSPEFLNEFSSRVSAVRTGDVQEVVKRALNLDQLVVVVAGDASEISKSLESAKLGPVKRISVADIMR
jgi:zinc protease